MVGVRADNAVDGAAYSVSGRQFLFDTGAQLSVVSSAVAVELGLDLDNPDMSIEVGGAGGSLTVDGYYIDSLTLPRDDDNDGVIDGQLVFRNVPVFVLDLDPRLDGILGMNLFNPAAQILYDPWDPDGAGPGGPSIQMTFTTASRTGEDPEALAALNQLGTLNPLFSAFAGSLGGARLPLFDTAPPDPAPQVVSIDRTTPTGPLTSAPSVTFTVTFSEPVTGVDAADFVLALNGVTAAPVVTVSGGGATYTVTVTGVAGDGTLGLNLADDDSIADAAGNPLGGAGAGNADYTGQVYAVDRTAPTSQMSPLPAAQATAAFTVGWSGSDGTGSGGLRYTVSVATDGGPFTPWLEDSPLTSATFSGQDGHAYAFYSVATDAAGNREAAPATADATTAVLVVPPASPPPAPPPPSGGGPVRPVVVGGATDGSVRLVTAAGVTATLTPFGNTGTATRMASADVDGDGAADVVAVTGPGTPLRVAVLSGRDGSVLVAPFDPFGGGFPGGGYVAAADLDRDGRAEFAVTPDQGGGPRVAVFALNTDGSTAVRANFFGIDDPNFRGGARAALGDVNGDGTPDVVVAAGFGGGPRTAIFTGQSVLAGSPQRLVSDFFAFPGADAQNLRNGSFVAAGDVTGDGFADLVFGGGPGGAPRVFILSGALVSAGQADAAQASPIANFFVAGDLADRGGARVAVTNSDGDGRADVAVGSGAGRPAKVRVYLGKDFAGGGEPTATDLDPFDGAVLADGVYIG